MTSQGSQVQSLPRPPLKTPSNQRFGGVFVCLKRVAGRTWPPTFRQILGKTPPSFGKFWACGCWARTDNSRVANTAGTTSGGGGRCSLGGGEPGQLSNCAEAAEAGPTAVGDQRADAKRKAFGSVRARASPRGRGRIGSFLGTLRPSPPSSSRRPRQRGQI